MARIDFPRQDGEWSQSPSRSFLKNRASEIFVNIYRLVVYVVETYIGKYVYIFFSFLRGGGMYTYEMIPKKYQHDYFPTIPSFSALEISLYFALF